MYIYISTYVYIHIHMIVYGPYKPSYGLMFDAVHARGLGGEAP